jgi:carboxyl-terminal processing protease
MKLAWLTIPVIGLAVAANAMGWAAQESQSNGMSTYQQLDLFTNVLERVRADYVEDIDTPKAMEAAINGMLASLDPHSSYLNPQEFRDMNTTMRGEYGGLGIEVTTEEGVVKVVSPIDDTPAARAGVQSGDYITHIDNEAIVGVTLTEAVDKMRGAVGTGIKLTIAREGADEPIDVDLVREMISVRAVTNRVDGDIGVIRISTFNEKVGENLEAALRDLKGQMGGSMKGLVLDLRNNAGGRLDQANRVADAFLDGGMITSTKGRNPEDVKRYTARRGDMLNGLPVVVLINQGSASASEIVAGALQDRNRGLVVGVTSFGKGSVQTLIPLNEGRDGALRLTTASYYTPSGRSIQKCGIEPDKEVAQVYVDQSRLRKLGLTEADLKSARSNTHCERRGPHVIADHPPKEWERANDWQMKRAMEMLRSNEVAEFLKTRTAG